MRVDDGVEIRLTSGSEEFPEALRIRRAVFVDEQGGPPEDEPDAWDASARHWLVLLGGQAIGTARLYEPSPGVGKVGRVAVLPEFRGAGVGRRLVEEVAAHARAHGYREVILDAQTAACAFYERLGFTAEGEVFMEAGIPHQRMRRAF